MAWNAAWSASQQEPNPTVGGIPATEHAQTDFLAVNDAAGMADDFPALGTAVKSIGRAARSSRTSQAAATGKKQRGTSKSSQSKPAGVLDGSALPKGRESKPAVRLLDAPPKPTAKRAPKPEEASQPQAWEIEGQRINREQKARVDARRAEATQQKLAPEVDGASERQADGDAALESDAVEDDGAAQKRSRRRAGNRFQAKMVVKPAMKQERAMEPESAPTPEPELQRETVPDERQDTGTAVEALPRKRVPTRVQNAGADTIEAGKPQSIASVADGNGRKPKEMWTHPMSIENWSSEQLNRDRCAQLMAELQLSTNKITAIESVDSYQMKVGALKCWMGKTCFPLDAYVSKLQEIVQDNVSIMARREHVESIKSVLATLVERQVANKKKTFDNEQTHRRQHSAYETAEETLGIEFFSQQQTCASQQRQYQMRLQEISEWLSRGVNSQGVRIEDLSSVNVNGDRLTDVPSIRISLMVEQIELKAVSKQLVETLEKVEPEYHSNLKAIEVHFNQFSESYEPVMQELRGCMAHIDSQIEDVRAALLEVEGRGTARNMCKDDVATFDMLYALLCGVQQFDFDQASSRLIPVGAGQGRPVGKEHPEAKVRTLCLKLNSEFAEFGGYPNGSLTENMTVDEIVQTVRAVFPAYTGIGETTQECVSTQIKRLMPAGSDEWDVARYLGETYGMGAAQRHAVMLRFCLIQEPVRYANKIALREALDVLVAEWAGNDVPKRLLRSPTRSTAGFFGEIKQSGFFGAAKERFQAFVGSADEPAPEDGTSHSVMISLNLSTVDVIRILVANSLHLQLNDVSAQHSIQKLAKQSGTNPFELSDTYNVRRLAKVKESMEKWATKVVGLVAEEFDLTVSDVKVRCKVEDSTALAGQIPTKLRNVMSIGGADVIANEVTLEQLATHIDMVAVSESSLRDISCSLGVDLSDSVVVKFRESNSMLPKEPLDSWAKLFDRIDDDTMDKKERASETGNKKKATMRETRMITPHQFYAALNTVVTLVAQPDKVAVIRKFTKSTGCYSLVLASGDRMKLHPANVDLHHKNGDTQFLKFIGKNARALRKQCQVIGLDIQNVEQEFQKHDQQRRGGIDVAEFRQMMTHEKPERVKVQCARHEVVGILIEAMGGTLEKLHVHAASKLQDESSTFGFAGQLGPVTRQLVQQLWKHRMRSASFDRQLQKYLDEYWHISTSEMDSILLVATVSNLRAMTERKKREAKENADAEEQRAEQKKQEARRAGKKKLKKKKTYFEEGMNIFENIRNKQASLSWDLRKADLDVADLDVAELLDESSGKKNRDARLGNESIIGKKRDGKTSRNQSTPTAKDISREDFEAFVDECVAVYGAFAKIRFTRASGSSSVPNKLPSDSSEHVVSSVQAILAVHFKVPTLDVGGATTVSRLVDAQKNSENERRDIHSLCCQVALRLGNGATAHDDPTCSYEVLGLLLRVPTCLSISTVSDRCHTPSTLLTQPQQTLMDYALATGDVQLAATLCGACEGKGLTVKHIHASAAWMSEEHGHGRDTGLFELLLRYYPNPAELVRTAFSVPIPICHGADVEQWMSTEFDWFVLGVPSHEGTVESVFTDTASAFASMETGIFPVSPFAFCSASMAQSLMVRYAPGKRREIMPPCFLLIQKRPHLKPTIEVIEGAGSPRQLSTFAESQLRPAVPWIPIVEQLLEIGPAFDRFYSWLRSLELPIGVEEIRGLRGRCLLHCPSAHVEGRFSCQPEFFARSSATACDIAGQTPLHVAARHGNDSALKTLFSLADDPIAAADLRTKGGLSPLHFAAKFHNLSCARLLLDMNSGSVDCTSKTGRTPCQLAVLTTVAEGRSGWESVVNELLQAGADPFFCSDDGESVLSIALMCTGLGASLLGEQLDNVLEQQQPGCAASESSRLRIDDLCIHGLVRDCSGAKHVKASPAFRRLHALLELGADVNRALPVSVHRDEPTPLHCAASADVIDLLVGYGALINKRCGDSLWTPLHSVVASTIRESEKLESCRCLLLHGAEYQNTVLSSKRQTPVDLAQERGLQSVQQLFADESQRRLDNYEDDMARHMKKAKQRLSSVERALADTIAVQRADIKSKITAVLEMRLRAPDSIDRNGTNGAERNDGDDSLMASQFDSSALEIFMTEWGVDSLFSVDTQQAARVLATLQTIADGGIPTTDSHGIFAAPVEHCASFIVGEVSFMHSVRTRQYSQAVRIWNIERSAQSVDRSKRSLLSSIQNGLKSRLCNDQYAPWADSAGAAGMTIVKLFQLTDAMAGVVCQRAQVAPHSAREFPFAPDAAESDVIQKATQNSSALVLGRSGTGKTSILLNIMFQAYSAHCKAAGPEGSAPPKPFNQIFVTCNAVLVGSVRKSFGNMHLGAIDLQPLPAESDSASFPKFLNRQQFLLFLDDHVPDSFFRGDQEWDNGGASQSLDTQFVRQSLLGKRKALKDRLQIATAVVEKSAIQHQLQKVIAELKEQKINVSSRPKQTAAKKVQRGQLIDFVFFTTKMWPLMVRNRSKISSSAVYTEIVSHIRGSVQALTTGELSEQEYISLPRKTSPLTRPDAEIGDEYSRKNVYSLYKKYQALKVSWNCWDIGDLVAHIYRQVKGDRWAGPPIHAILADEVQDFSQAECALMIEISADTNRLFFSGDTAQTISRVGFRFEDLKLYFHQKKDDERKQGRAVAMQTNVPDIMQLTTNFRTHDGVLRAASAVVSTIIRLFPGSIDILGDERGAFDGPVPLLLPDREAYMLSKFVKLTMGTEQNSPIAFGANQVVIVRTQEAKEQLPAEFQSCLVLTVPESKGLEFNDVLLYNFFSDSDASLSDWAAVLHPEELDLHGSRLGHHNFGLLSQPKSDAAEIMDLCEDMKQLYVALTRARRRVILYDDSDVRIPLFELLEKRGLATVATLEDLGPNGEQGGAAGENRGGEEWNVRGKQLMEVSAYEEAVKCFRRGNDQANEFLATAHFKEEAAQVRQADLAVQQMMSAGGDGERLPETNGDEEYRKLSRDAAFCFLSYLAATEDGHALRFAHRCFLAAGEEEYGQQLLASHECSICYDDEEERLKIMTECGHAFHRHCLRDWQATDRGAGPHSKDYPSIRWP